MERVSYSQIYKILGATTCLHKNDFQEVEFVVGVSRGGLIPAVYIATKLNKPLVVAYIDKSDGVYFDRIEWIKDRRVLLVDDIVRTGKTLSLIKNLLLKKGARGVRTLTIFCLDKAKVRPDFTNYVKTDIVLPWD